MKISIIVTAYNVEHYIERCLESLICQTWTDMEVIVVDDASSDDTLKKIHFMTERDERIRSVQCKRNGGVSHARNEGIKRASGEYMIFVDGDDYIADIALENICKSIMKNSYPDIIYSNGNYEFYTNNYYLLKNEVKDYYQLGVVNGLTLLQQFMDYGIRGWSIWGKAFRREFWLNLGFESTECFMEDMDIMYKVLEQADKISIIEPYYYYYRRREGSLLTQFNSYHLLVHMHVLERWLQYLSVDKMMPQELKLKIKQVFNDEYCCAVLPKIFLVSKDERGELLDNADKLLVYLEYPKNRRNLLIKYSVKLLGFRNTCFILSILKRVRYSQLKGKTRKK